MKKVMMDFLNTRILSGIVDEMSRLMFVHKLKKIFAGDALLVA